MKGQRSGNASCSAALINFTEHYPSVVRGSSFTSADSDPMQQGVLTTSIVVLSIFNSHLQTMMRSFSMSNLDDFWQDSEILMSVFLTRREVCLDEAA